MAIAPVDDRLAPNVAVYVSAAGSGEVHVLRPSPASPSSATSALRTVQTLALGGAIMPMAWRPDHRHLYAIDRKAPFAVHTLAVDAHSGLLTHQGSSPLAGNIVQASVSIDGRTLLGASYGEDFIALHAIEADGLAGRALQALPTPRHAHCIVPSPDGRHVWVACLGADELRAYAWQGSSGLPAAPLASTSADMAATVATLSSEPVCVHACRPPGQPRSGPRHLAFHPHRPWLFVINELDGTVDALALSDATSWDRPGGAPEDHAASPLAVRPLTSIRILPAARQYIQPWSAELRLSADGQWLFATDRRAATLSAIRIVDDSDSHSATACSLHLVDCIDTEPLPRSFALSPDGRHAFVASQDTGRLSVVGFDAQAGRLTLQSQLPCGTPASSSPTWVEAIALQPPPAA